MPEKILIVDDDLDSLRLISLMLQRHNYEVITASAGNQGISKATSASPDLIILDVMMPDMDGYEVCRRLRANPPTQNIPIIMFTAKTLVEDKTTGFEAGADDYLTKPTHPAELASRVKAMLERSAERRTEVENGYGLVIGVIGTKGGIGTTTIALNLAAAYKMMGENPIVADIRLGTGSLGLFLGLEQSTGMAKLLRKPIPEIGSSIEHEIVIHSTGLRAILSSISPKEALLPVSVEATQEIIAGLRVISKPTVLDLGRGYSPLIKSLQSMVDELIVLVEPTGVNLSMARSLLQELMIGGREHINIVVVSHNNIHLHPPWHEVERILDHDIRSIIAAAPEIAFEAMEAGIPIVNYRPHAIIASQISKLASDIQAKAKVQ